MGAMTSVSLIAALCKARDVSSLQTKIALRLALRRRRALSLGPRTEKDNVALGSAGNQSCGQTEMLLLTLVAVYKTESSRKRNTMAGTTPH